MSRAIWLRLVARLTRRLQAVAASRPPDFIVGTPDAPYLRRWYLTPWSGLYRGVDRPTRWQRFVRGLPNVYLHEFCNDDDDRAHHDHPWPSVSLLLSGVYIEHQIAAGGVHHRQWSRAGDVRVRGARFTHRLSLVSMGGQINAQGEAQIERLHCWSLFITGFAVRCKHTGVRGDWGFHCERGWVQWKRFTDTRDGVSTTGRGCE